MQLYKEDIELTLKEFVSFCDGVLMAAKFDGFLHNFAWGMKNRLSGLLQEIELCKKIDTLKSESNDNA